MLTEIKFAPGIDKQDTSVGATARWVDSDNTRFRYGLPEKVGGWSSLLNDTIVGVARKTIPFVDKVGNRYVAIGTDKFLLIYFEGILYDITPWRTNAVGAPLFLTTCTLATTSTSNKNCIITTPTDHDLIEGDMIVLDSVTLPGGTGLSATDFEDKLFQVLSVPSPTTFTINSANQASAVVATGGTMTVQPYAYIGPAEQTYGYGFGVGPYGGTVAGVATTKLNIAINATDGSLTTTLSAGITDADTVIPLVDSTIYGSTGTVMINTEVITYTGNVANELTGAVRGVGAVSHLSGEIVSNTILLIDASGFPASGTILADGEFSLTGDELFSYTLKSGNYLGNLTRGISGTTAGNWSLVATLRDATDFAGWGSPVDAATIVLEPGLWSLDTFGDVLVATIANGKTFTWDSSVSAKFTNRASQLTTSFETNNNPVASRVSLVSPTTRHLIHFGTCTTANDSTTQDDMFIKFSANEEINVYDVLATNTAGTFRLQDGTRIVGALVAKETILVWTDNALYTMKFVGAPFTFGFEQVGTNCGLIGKNAVTEIDGIAYWMSNNGFFAFDGTVKTLPCSVEDYVFDDIDTTKGQQICAGLNNLFTEVTWWYPTSGSDFNNRSVVYNYGVTNQEVPLPTGNWYTNININSIRTSWIDTLIYPRPYGTKYNSTNTGTFPVVIGETGLGQTVFFEHETGNDQINPDGSTTTLTSFVKSYNFSIDPKSSELFLAMRRFLPNFKVLTGSSLVTIGVSDWPANSAGNSSFSPFTITSTTQYKDTRARGRYASIKIENINVGETWRFGTFQVDIQPDGRR